MTLATLKDKTITGEGFSLTLDEHTHAVSLYFSDELESMPFKEQVDAVAAALGVALGWTTSKALYERARNEDFRELAMRSLARVYVLQRWPMPLELVLATSGQTSDGRG